MEDNKYNCEKCAFTCNTKARWDAHINTTLHKTGVKKRRCDYKEPLKCNSCLVLPKFMLLGLCHKIIAYFNLPFYHI